MARVAWVNKDFLSPAFNIEGDKELANRVPFPWTMSLESNIDPGPCGLAWLWRTVCTKLSIGDCDALDDKPTGKGGKGSLSCGCQLALDDLLDTTTGGRWMRMSIDSGMKEVPIAEVQYELLEKHTIYTWFVSHCGSDDDGP